MPPPYWGGGVGDTHTALCYALDDSVILCVHVNTYWLLSAVKWGLIIVSSWVIIASWLRMYRPTTFSDPVSCAAIHSACYSMRCRIGPSTARVWLCSCICFCSRVSLVLLSVPVQVTDCRLASEMTYCVDGDVKPYSLTFWLLNSEGIIIPANISWKKIIQQPLVDT